MIKTIFKKIYFYLPFKLPVFKFIRSFLPLPEKIFRHLHFKGKFTVEIDKKNKETFQLISDGEIIENEIFWGGITAWYEKVSMEYWIKLCRISDCIFDVGAYHGIYSLVAKGIDNNKKVFAFEPVDDSFTKLERNIHINSFSIIPIHCAVSNKDGIAEFYNINAVSSMIGSLSKESFTHGEEIVKRTVPVKSLKSIISEHNLSKIDLIKIDVEGHEYEVIEGLGEYLGLYKPSVLLEVIDDNLAIKINELFMGKGYLFFDIDEKHPPKQIPGIKRSSYFNILACTPAIAKKIDLIK